LSDFLFVSFGQQLVNAGAACDLAAALRLRRWSGGGGRRFSGDFYFLFLKKKKTFSHKKLSFFFSFQVCSKRTKYTVTKSNSYFNANPLEYLNTLATFLKHNITNFLKHNINNNNNIQIQCPITSPT